MKRSFIAILLICIGFFLYGNSQTEQLTILKKTFYRGNLQDKMAYYLVYTSPLYSDRQAEPQLAECPECLGEIYEYDLRQTVGAALYHKSCVERMMKNGDRRDLPSGAGGGPDLRTVRVHTPRRTGGAAPGAASATRGAELPPLRAGLRARKRTPPLLPYGLPSGVESGETQKDDEGGSR